MKATTWWWSTLQVGEKVDSSLHIKRSKYKMSKVIWILMTSWAQLRDNVPKPIISKCSVKPKKKCANTAISKSLMMKWPISSLRCSSPLSASTRCTLTASEWMPLRKSLKTNAWIVLNAKVRFKTGSWMSTSSRKTNSKSKRTRECTSSNSILNSFSALAKTSWSLFLEILFKDRKMTRVNFCQMRPLVIWLTSESSAANAKRTSVPSVKLNHITLVRLAIKLMPGLADSVKKCSSSHLLRWNQRLEMCAENPSVSVWCRNLATRCIHVVILASVLLLRPSAFHAWSLNVSKRWTRPRLPKKTRKTTVISVGAQLSGKPLAVNWSVATSST